MTDVLTYALTCSGYVSADDIDVFGSGSHSIAIGVVVAMAMVPDAVVPVRQAVRLFAMGGWALLFAVVVTRVVFVPRYDLRYFGGPWVDCGTLQELAIRDMLLCGVYLLGVVSFVAAARLRPAAARSATRETCSSPL